MRFAAFSVFLLWLIDSGINKLRIIRCDAVQSNLLSSVQRGAASDFNVVASTTHTPTFPVFFGTDPNVRDDLYWTMSRAAKFGFPTGQVQPPDIICANERDAFRDFPFVTKQEIEDCLNRQSEYVVHVISNTFWACPSFFATPSMGRKCPRIGMNRFGGQGSFPITQQTLFVLGMSELYQDVMFGQKMITASMFSTLNEAVARRSRNDMKNLPAFIYSKLLQPYHYYWVLVFMITLSDIIQWPSIAAKIYLPSIVHHGRGWVKRRRPTILIVARTP